MKRILHIINGMSSGGAEAYIMNIYRRIDRNKIQFDFLLRDGKKNNYYIEEINSLGGRVYFVPDFPKHFVNNYLKTKKFFEEHKEYETVEIHANALIYIIPLWILKGRKDINVIMHSHSTTTANNFIKPFHFLNRNIIHFFCHECFACSDNAGRWMFKNKYKVINNAIDVKYFQNPNNPFEYSHKYVICNVARFLPVKNHSYLIRIFDKFHKIHPDSVLILVGEGPLKKNVMKMVSELKLSSSVQFMGEVKNVANILANATCFVLPSLYEGIPLTIMEAQAAGIHCVVSNNVDRNCDITHNIEFVALTDENTWISEMGKNRKLNKEIVYDQFVNAGYEITHNIKRIENIYLKGRQK